MVGTKYGHDATIVWDSGELTAEEPLGDPVVEDFRQFVELHEGAPAGVDPVSGDWRHDHMRHAESIWSLAQRWFDSVQITGEGLPDWPFDFQPLLPEEVPPSDRVY